MGSDLSISAKKPFVGQIGILVEDRNKLLMQDQRKTRTREHGEREKICVDERYSLQQTFETRQGENIFLYDRTEEGAIINASGYIHGRTSSSVSLYENENENLYLIQQG